MSGHTILGLVLFLVWTLLAGWAAWPSSAGAPATAGSASPPLCGVPGNGANRISGGGSVVVGVAAPVADILGLDHVAPPLSSPALRTAAVVVAAAGVVCTYAAQPAMGTAWRIGVDPTERTGLVTSAPFAIVRNPIFTAALITFTGLAFIIPNLVTFGGLVVVYTRIQMQVRAVEEPHLLATHGQGYADCAVRGGRFLPSIGRHRPHRPE